MPIRELFNLSAKSSDRLAWMDYAKGIAITMVVFRHLTIGIQLGGIPIDAFLYEVVDNVGLTLRMPLFFLLSGIFFRKSILKRSEIGYVLHKSKTIIYPYLVWALIITTIQIILSSYVNANVSWWSYLDIFIAPSGHWWFLVALFNISVLYLVMYMLTRGNHVLLLLAGLAMFYIAPHVEYFSIHHHILRLFIFFVMGDIISKSILDKSIKPVLLSGRLLFVFVAFTIVGEWILFQEAWRENTTLLLLFPLIGSCAIICFSNKLSVQNSKYISLLRTLGQHSLYVYLLHSMIGGAVRISFVHVLGINNYWLIIPISLLISLILPIYIFRLCMAYGFWFLFSTEAPADRKHASKPVQNHELDALVRPMNSAVNSQIVNS